ncbi:MAG: hypothetical protein HN348_07595 [Proteobacteria bacterium]|nr:hypothetical protein [Pseudomonadota bacterium]
MARKRIKVEVLLSAIVVMLFAGFGGVVLRPDFEPDHTLPSRFGDVTWNHELHARHEGISNCTVCHHQEQQGNMNPSSCHECHKPLTNQEALIIPHLFMDVEEIRYEGENGPPPRVAFHNRCIGCHRAMDEGPLACRDCHEQRFSGTEGVVQWDHRMHARKLAMPKKEGSNDNCLHCHHQDEDARNDGEYRACESCHESAAVKGMDWATEIAEHQGEVHGECQTCHVDFNPEEDDRSCHDCHKQIFVDTNDENNEERPTIEAAVHEKCLECHNPDYKDLTPAMPVSCSECHRPDPSWLEVPEVGQVLWNHKSHGKYREEVDCQTCHHTDQVDEPHTACSQCHDASHLDNPSTKEALEETCLGCHKDEHNGLDTWAALMGDRSTDKADQEQFKRGYLSFRGRRSTEADSKHRFPVLESQPTEAGGPGVNHEFEAPEGKLWWNHRAHAVDYAFACRSCHHTVLKEGEEFVTQSRAKLDQWPEEASRIQNCRNCHGEEGPTVGSPAANTDAPKLGDVYQAICIECHVELEAAPQTWSEFFTVHNE